MDADDIAVDCDRVVRAALAESSQAKQLAMLLSWIIERGKDGSLYVVPPLDEMLGLPKKRSEDARADHAVDRVVEASTD